MMWFAAYLLLQLPCVASSPYGAPLPVLTFPVVFAVTQHDEVSSRWQLPAAPVCTSSNEGAELVVE